MSLTLLDVGLTTSPVYIHKIDSPSHWNSTDDFEQRVNNAVARIFKDSENLYSFWRIESNLDLCCVAASLNAGRTSPREKISFIWITDSDLKALSLIADQTKEGTCLHAENLHYNISISSMQAHEFCTNSMSKERKDLKYSRGNMSVVIEYLTERGCKVYGTSRPTCDCQLLNL
jgi:hypothetical protein